MVDPQRSSPSCSVLRDGRRCRQPAEHVEVTSWGEVRWYCPLHNLLPGLAVDEGGRPTFHQPEDPS